MKEVLIAAVLLLLFQVFCRRNGIDFTLPKLALPRLKKHTPLPVEKKRKKPLAPPAEEKQPQEKEEVNDTFSEALSRAKGK